MHIDIGAEIRGGIVERVLRGGMGVVCITREPETGRRWAWKTYDAGQKFTRTSELFKNEALYWTLLPSHPCVVPAWNVEEADSRLMIRLEYMEGGSLFDRIRTGQIDLNEALSIAYSVALGMDFIHEYAGLIHRDLKPENVLLDSKGVGRVSDLGLAVVLGDPTRPGPLIDLRNRLDSVGQLGTAGTVQYMAPELLEERAVATRATDVFAYGATLYFALTGDAPFSGWTTAHLVERMKCGPPPITRSDVPKQLLDLIAACLDVEPTSRPQSFSIIVKELEAIFTLLSVSPRFSAESVHAEMLETCDSSGYWSRVGYTLKRFGDSQLSADAYQRAYEIDPENPANVVNCGVAQKRLGNPELAVEFLTRAIDMCAGGGSAGEYESNLTLLAWANLSLASALYDLRRVDEALAAAKVVLQFDDYRAVALREIAKMEEYERRPSSVTCDLLIETRLKESENGRGALLLDAVIMSSERARHSGLYVLQELFNRYTHDSRISYNLGVALFRSGYFEEACELIVGAARASGAGELQLLSASLALTMCNRYDEARAVLVELGNGQDDSTVVQSARAILPIFPLVTSIAPLLRDLRFDP